MSSSPRKQPKPARANPAGSNPVAQPSSVANPAAGPRPRVLAVVCLVVLIQAALLVGLGVAWISDLLRGASQLPGATVFLVLFALGIAAALIAATRGLWRGRRWARAPVITWQLLLGVMAVQWLDGQVAVWAVLLLAGDVLVVAALFLPTVLAATSGKAHLPDDGDRGTRVG